MPLDILAPSTILHMGGKFLQMAATNNTTGHHKNTHFSVVQSKMLVCSSTEHDVGVAPLLDAGPAAQCRGEGAIEGKRQGRSQQRIDIQVRAVPDAADKGIQPGIRHAVSCVGQQTFSSIVRVTGGATERAVEPIQGGGLSSIEWIKDNRGRDHF